jgi:hypothetical protein
MQKGGRSIVEASHPKYSPGQVWKYKTRPAEQQSRAVVLRVDKSPVAGFIVHVAVSAVIIRSPSSRDGVAREISHLPFSEGAVDQSVTELETVGPVPNFQDGHQTWREAFDQHKGGFWTVPVAEAVGAMETALNQGK